MFLICFFVLLPSKLCIFWGSSEIKAIFEELQCQQKHGSSYLVKCKKSFRKPRAFLMNPCVTVIARIRILIFRDSFIPFTPVIDSMHFSQFHESVLSFSYLRNSCFVGLEYLRWCHTWDELQKTLLPYFTFDGIFYRDPFVAS